jgi:hypothetical protein
VPHPLLPFIVIVCYVSPSALEAVAVGPRMSHVLCRSLARAERQRRNRNVRYIAAIQSHKPNVTAGGRQGGPTKVSLHSKRHGRATPPTTDGRTGQPLQGRARTLADTKRSTLTRLYDHDVRVAPWAGTAHGVIQAVNTYEHHEGTIRGAARPERNMLRTVTGDVGKLDRTTMENTAERPRRTDACLWGSSATRELSQRSSSPPTHCQG